MSYGIRYKMHLICMGNNSKYTISNIAVNVVVCIWGLASAGPLLKFFV